MSSGGTVSDSSGEVAVSPLARPAADMRWQQSARRLSAFGVLCLIVVLGAVGGVKALFFTPAAVRATPNYSVQGVTTEARILDLATSCVRDANNYDQQQHAADIAAGTDPYLERLAHCYALTPDLLPKVWDGQGTRQAAEPLAAITRRTADGMAATVVIRLRVSGNPLPLFRYFSVDVGCRPDGTCSLTTVPTEVKGLDGDPMEASATTTPSGPTDSSTANPATSKP